MVLNTEKWRNVVDRPIDFNRTDLHLFQSFDFFYEKIQFVGLGFVFLRTTPSL